jgi:hypothetical protein
MNNMMNFRYNRNANPNPNPNPMGTFYNPAFPVGGGSWSTNWGQTDFINPRVRRDNVAGQPQQEWRSGKSLL